MLLGMAFTFQGQDGICVFATLFHVCEHARVYVCLGICLKPCECVLLPVVVVFLVSNWRAVPLFSLMAFICGVTASTLCSFLQCEVSVHRVVLRAVDVDVAVGLTFFIFYVFFFFCS